MAPMVSTGEELEEPIVENLLEVEAHKSPEPYHPPVALERGVEVSAAQSEDRIQDALENNPAIELTSSDLPLEVTSIETPLQGDLIIETPAAQDNQTPDNIVTADSEASPGKDLGMSQASSTHIYSIWNCCNILIYP